MPGLKSATRNYALFFVASVLFHAAGTWSLPLIDRDEPRFAEASREMRARSDYVVPYFNNQFRFDKPPLTYWMQVGSFKIFGETDFAARFPSTVAAALTALLIVTWGSRIGGQKLGWWAAMIFTLSLQTFVHAKAAVADMWLVLFVTTAHWAGYELLHDRPPERDQRSIPIGRGGLPNQGTTASPPPKAIWKSPFLVFYISLAFAFLGKGPIGWTPLLTVCCACFFTRHANVASQFKFVRGSVLMLAIIAIWGAPALIRTHGEFFWVGIGRHVIGRSFGAMEGHGADSLGVYLLLLPFYFVTVFVSFLPWSIKLPRLVGRLWGELDWTDTYLLCGAGIIFLIFTLVKTKLPHYTLPAFPLLALVLARLLIADGSALFLKRVTIAAGATYLAIALVVPPFIAPLFPAAALLRQSRDDLRPEMEFGAVDFAEPSIVWYFRSRVTGWMTMLNHNNVAEFMNKPGSRFAVMPTSLVDRTFPVPPDSWRRFSTCGFNIPKGRRVNLTVLLKPK
jgi:4-amino-4-deoxy-L-arabinose transferase-like glycosyltransferase